MKQVFTIVVGSVFQIPIKSKMKTNELEEPLLEYDCIYQKKKKKGKKEKDKAKRKKKKKSKKDKKSKKHHATSSSQGSEEDDDSEQENSADSDVDDAKVESMMGCSLSMHHAPFISQNRNGMALLFRLVMIRDDWFSGRRMNRTYGDRLH